MVFAPTAAATVVRTAAAPFPVSIPTAQHPAPRVQTARSNALTGTPEKRVVVLISVQPVRSRFARTDATLYVAPPALPNLTHINNQRVRLTNQFDSAHITICDTVRFVF